MRHLGQIKHIRPVDATHEALALLKILALGNRQLAEGKVKPIAEVARRLREHPSAN